MSQQTKVIIARYLMLASFVLGLCCSVAVNASGQSATYAIEQRLLARAHEALDAGRLSTPSGDNALDLFRSVLILNPDSGQAQAGIDALMLAYAELARSALRKERFDDAEALMARAEGIISGTSLIGELRSQLAQAKAKSLARDQALMAAGPKAVLSEFVLPKQALRRKDKEVVRYLSQIAERISDTGESVMIYARTDAEGRWIYQQMKAAVSGYRIRGDIRIAEQPKLSLLPPL